MVWPKGKPHSEETRRKLSLAGKGRPHSPEHRANLAAANRITADKARGVPLSAERRQRIADGQRGLKHSPEWRENQRLGALRHAAQCDGSCGKVSCSPTTRITNHKWENTSLERRLSELLSEFPTVQRQQNFGRYRVDAYLPEYCLAFEADGHYWHRDRPGMPERDAKRDAAIKERFGVTVVRLDEDDLGLPHRYWRTGTATSKETASVGLQPVASNSATPA